MINIGKACNTFDHNEDSDALTTPLNSRLCHLKSFPLDQWLNELDRRDKREVLTMGSWTDKQYELRVNI